MANPLAASLPPSDLASSSYMVAPAVPAPGSLAASLPPSDLASSVHMMAPAVSAPVPQVAVDPLNFSQEDVISSFPHDVVKLFGGVENFRNLRRQKYFKYTEVTSKAIHLRDLDYLKTMGKANDIWLEVGTSEDLNEDADVRKPGKPMLALAFCRNEESDAKGGGSEESIVDCTRKYCLKIAEKEFKVKSFRVIYRYCFSQRVPFMTAYVYNETAKVQLRSRFPRKFLPAEMAEFVRLYNAETLADVNRLSSDNSASGKPAVMQQIVALTQKLIISSS